MLRKTTVNPMRKKTTNLLIKKKQRTNIFWGNTTVNPVRKKKKLINEKKA